MSRYTQFVGPYEYAWGYDEQTDEFFFYKEDTTAHDEEEGVIFDIGNYMTTLKPHPDTPSREEYSNLDIFKIIQKEMELNDFEIPIEHLTAIKNKTPF